MQKEIEIAKAMYHLAAIADRLAEASSKVTDRYARGSEDAYKYMKTEIAMEAEHLGIALEKTVNNAAGELYTRVKTMRKAVMGLVNTYDNKLKDGLLYSKKDTEHAFIVIQSVLNDIYYQETGGEL